MAESAAGSSTSILSPAQVVGPVAVKLQAVWVNSKASKLKSSGRAVHLFRGTGSLDASDCRFPSSVKPR